MSTPARGKPATHSWRDGLRRAVRRVFRRAAAAGPADSRPPTYAVEQLDAEAEDVRAWLDALHAAAQDRERPARTVYADRSTQAWLAGIPTAPHCVQPWPPSANLNENAEPTVLILRADSLPTLAERCPPPATCVAVWTEDDPLAPYRWRVELQRWAHICFATDPLTRARLRLFMPRVSPLPPGRALLDMALALAGRGPRATAAATPAPTADGTSAAATQRPLRVLLQVNDLARGGLEQVVLHVAEVLTARRIAVTILVLGKEGPAAERARRSGLGVCTLPRRRQAVAYAQLLQNQGIDVISAHYCLFGAAIASELGVPFVQTIHNAYVWLTRAQINELWAADVHTHAYLAVSADAACYADARLGLPAHKMIIVPNGIDTLRVDAARSGVDRADQRMELGFGPDDFVFLNVGSICAQKAQVPLVQALAQALRKNPRLRLAVLGGVADKAYHRRLQHEIRRLGVEHAVRMVGFCDDASRFYSLADAFVLPSYWEGCSLALAEAVCAGLPVVASDVGYARELLAQAGGRLVPPPFDSIAELEPGGAWSLPPAREGAFIDELAQALLAVAHDPRPPTLSDELRRSLDRRHAYAAYDHVLRWLASGGSPVAARAFVCELHPAGQRRHSAGS